MGPEKEHVSIRVETLRLPAVLMRIEVTPVEPVPGFSYEKWKCSKGHVSTLVGIETKDEFGWVRRHCSVCLGEFLAMIPQVTRYVE
jgi:hypothetical protein